MRAGGGDGHSQDKGADEGERGKAEHQRSDNNEHRVDHDAPEDQALSDAHGTLVETAEKSDGGGSGCNQLERPSTQESAPIRGPTTPARPTRNGKGGKHARPPQVHKAAGPAPAAKGEAMVSIPMRLVTGGDCWHYAETTVCLKCNVDDSGYNYEPEAVVWASPYGQLDE